MNKEYASKYWFWRVLDLNPPPSLPGKTVDFGTDPHPCLWQLTFPNVNNPPPKKKTVDFGTGDAFTKKTLTFLCFCACRRCSWHSGRSTVLKSTVFFFWEEGGFLTLGKVNGAKIDRFSFGKKKQKKTQRKIGAKIDRFSGEEGGFRSKTRFYPNN